MNITEYEVTVESFADRHFIKTFAKKYKTSWDTTLGLIVQELRFIDVLFNKTIAECITDRSANVLICKTEFKIAGTKISRHGSGNRCIVALHKNISQVKILLVYHKTDLGGGSETGNWKRIIKENYKEYSSLL